MLIFPGFDLRCAPLAAAAFALLVFAAPRPAVQSGARTQQKEETCPWCKNDPKLLAAAGCVSHGPMPIGLKSSEEHSKDHPGRPWVYLETAHFRWASSLGAEPISQKDRPRVEAELARLRKALPGIPMRLAAVDPFLRMHLQAMKGEELYAKFQDLLCVKDADFPESWQKDQPYMGNGRFLGEKDKFELIIHSNRKTHHFFTSDQMGVRITDALRWHYPKIHKLVASIPAEDGDLKQDQTLFPHLAHNITHLMFCAYKHFSYDPPVWLDEGLAHYFELESGKDINITYCSEEGAAPDRDPNSNWGPKSHEILDRGKAATLPELLHRKSFGELVREDHVIAWSKVKFLADTRRAEFSKFLGVVKGQLDASGVPSGKDLPGLQRNAFRDCMRASLDDIDQAWLAWMKKPPAPQK